MINNNTPSSGLISRINEIYNHLHDWSADDLRARVDQLKAMVRASTDKEKLMFELLPEAFAILKETAKRFSNGDIRVKATPYDLKLAKKYDFAVINEDIAIYKNVWNVDGIPYRWNMIHYDEQLLGGIHLFLGEAIEMATGEGKTLVGTLPVFLRAISGEGVHMMTVNDYLSKRDYQITRPLYMFYGLSVDCIECHDRTDAKFERKQAYAADITFGANSSFVFDYLFDHIAYTEKECMKIRHNFAIIDEIDSILIDEADTPHIVSGGRPIDDGQIYKEHIDIIRELINIKNDSLYTANKLQYSARFTDEGKAWLRNKLHNNNLFSIRKAYEVTDFDSLSIEQKNLILNNIYLQNVLTQLLRALTVYERDVDYIVSGGKIRIIDQNTGRIKPNYRWRSGLHTAIEVKEGIDSRGDSNGMAVISLKNYFKLYTRIAGMSGSISPVKDELHDVYGLKSTAIPTHLPVIRQDNLLRIFKTSMAKDRAILKEVMSNRLAGRPTLIGTISLKRADQIEKILADAELEYNRLDARTTEREALTVAKAGIGNTITLSTSVAGRGTDIKPSDDALRNGGLSVIGCDLFGSVRTDLQLKGRAGRQGNPGSSTFFASLDDVVLEYLSESERVELNDLASRIDGDDISTDQIRRYFEIAQKNREDILRQQRITTAKKDDIIAPHRAKFYRERNMALFKADHASDIVYGVLNAQDESLPAITDRHIESLYHPTKILVARKRRNSLSEEYMLVPYAENKHPFALQLCLDSTIQDKRYFEIEFKRQNLLQIYDKFWKDFIGYVLQNLDENEISQLTDRYHKMMSAISAIITNRMQDSVPLFSIDSSDSGIEEKVTDTPLDANTQGCHHLNPDDSCPCGSGLAYRLCHGRLAKTSRPRRR